MIYPLSIENMKTIYRVNLIKISIKNSEVTTRYDDAPTERWRIQQPKR